MKKPFFSIFVISCVCGMSAHLWAGDTSHPGPGWNAYVPKYGKCSENGGEDWTVVIIPRVYIRYVGKDLCWSEVREVEINIDFLKLQNIAKEKGDTYTAGIMSHGNLVDFFTWLLEKGIYPMPGDALFGVLGYVQRNDYAGLYELYRSFGESRRLNRGR